MGRGWCRPEDCARQCMARTGQSKYVHIPVTDRTPKYRAEGTAAEAAGSIDEGPPESHTSPPAARQGPARAPPNVGALSKPAPTSSKTDAGYRGPPAPPSATGVRGSATRRSSSARGGERGGASASSRAAAHSAETASCGAERRARAGGGGGTGGRGMAAKAGGRRRRRHKSHVEA